MPAEDESGAEECFRHAAKNVQENFRELLENANDLIQSVDINGRFVYVNKKWLETLGYSREEVRKMRLPDIVRKDHIPRCMELFRRVCRGKSLEKIRTVFLTKDGREVYVCLLYTSPSPRD